MVNATLKVKRSMKGILLAGVLLLAGSALAASKGPLELQEPANLAGTQLKSGTYTVQWEGTGDQVQLKIFQGKKEVASTSAKMVISTSHCSAMRTLLRRNDDGSMTVTRINFGRKNFALEISSAAAVPADRRLRDSDSGSDERPWRAKGRAGRPVRITERWFCLSSAIYLRTRKSCLHFHA